MRLILENWRYSYNPQGCQPLTGLVTSALTSHHLIVMGCLTKKLRLVTSPRIPSVINRVARLWKKECEPHVSTDRPETKPPRLASPAGHVQDPAGASMTHNKTRLPNLSELCVHCSSNMEIVSDRWVPPSQYASVLIHWGRVKMIVGLLTIFYKYIFLNENEILFFIKSIDQFPQGFSWHHWLDQVKDLALKGDIQLSDPMIIQLTETYTQHPDLRCWYPKMEKKLSVAVLFNVHITCMKLIKLQSQIHFCSDKVAFIVPFQLCMVPSTRVSCSW